MANSFFYTDGGATKRTLYVAGTSTDRFVQRRSEFGWGWPKRAHFTEQLPSKYANLYRATSFPGRVYGFTARLKAASASALDTLMGTWEDYHNPDLGSGVVERVTHGAVTLQLECIPLAPEWTQINVTNAIVKQAYEAAFPWWHGATASTAADDFEDDTPVNVAIANTGDIATWPVAVITGIVNDPAITLADGTVIDVNKTTTNGDDTITIDWRPWGDTPKTAYFLENGAGTKVYLTITSASEWGRQDKGTNNCAIVADSGTPSIVISWHNYIGSLF